MEMRTLVQAAPGLQKLIWQELPIDKAYQLSCQIDHINKALEFYGREMAKNPAGEKLERLLSYDVGFENLEPVRLSVALPLRLSAAEVKQVAPFVVFEEVTADG